MKTGLLLISLALALGYSAPTLPAQVNAYSQKVLIDDDPNRTYFLIKSPDDNFAPSGGFKLLLVKLTKRKAAVRLETYAGGHGWHGDVFGAIRAGVEWLESGDRK